MKRGRKAKGAFTLIELLVILFLIAILLAIFWPVVHRALGGRRSAPGNLPERVRVIGPQ